ncbi:YafY family transcriptional regulator [Streptomonospora sp. S1-112]|uniref:YafY family transcriptional regulator n=1 Tax=Streptomonospora mangrovi TaxID=2883123 RepID=A0A9X3SEI4_9ACTN|nr:YafY family protein [Streptomonospora mangrovi]MDA0565918.1 YafY family transcriptional regulator [Streptomonospora mangrovi]
MADTSARLLRLLSLLQSAPDWPGPRLAERLGVTTRTVRNDVERLRGLGYPVHAAPGVGGGYRLGAGARLPPLVLDDAEAVAVAVGLRTAASGPIAGVEETALRALAKLEQVLPTRLRRQVEAVHTAVATAEAPPRTPRVDAEALLRIARACRDHELLRFDYSGRGGAPGVREVEPHRLVHTGDRWYLAAWDPARGDWRTFRVDRMALRTPNGPRFTPRPVPGGDVLEFVEAGRAEARWRRRATVLLHTGIEALHWMTPEWGVAEARGEHTVLLHTGGHSWDLVAARIGALGVDFEVVEPPDFTEHLRSMSRRYARAAGAAADGG